MKTVNGAMVQGSRNKRSIVLNLNSESGRERALDTLRVPVVTVEGTVAA